MDRPIEKVTGWKSAFTKKALPWWGGAALLALIAYLLIRPSERILRVNGSTLTISEVSRGEFNDYIRLSGQVQPMTTVQISPMESGIVEEIVIEEGSQVRKGDVIVLLRNENLDQQILTSEADLAEKENILRNTLITMEQDKLNLQQNILQIGVEARRAKRLYESQKALYEEKLISREDFLKAEEDYDLAVSRLKLNENRARQDSISRGLQVENLNESLGSMRLNMQMIRRRKDNLAIKAPIDGELGLLDVTLGQNVSTGSKIGQINDLSSYKIEAQIDEHYIDRVSSGLSASFERQGEQYEAVLRKVYPEVRDGKFKADFKFHGPQPANIRTGQTYYLNLQLGQPSEGILIPRGTFFQSTGGKWIFVMTDGNRAVRRSITIGRQNPQYYEVLDGLQPGEKVITSGYEAFGDNDVLILQ